MISRWYCHPLWMRRVIQDGQIHPILAQSELGSGSHLQVEMVQMFFYLVFAEGVTCIVVPQSGFHRCAGLRASSSEKLYKCWQP